MTKRTCPTCFGKKPNFHAKECRKCSNKTRTKTIEERFWKYVKKTPNCWIWTGAKDIAGYGRINFKNVSKPAHRISWEIKNGVIPKGLSICHSCDNPPCVNWDHLFMGTQAENSLDCTIKGRNACVRKLTEKDVIEIRKIYSESKLENRRRKIGFGEKSIAKRYNVSGNCIRSVITGKTWKHIL